MENWAGPVWFETRGRHKWKFSRYPVPIGTQNFFSGRYPVPIGTQKFFSGRYPFFKIFPVPGTQRYPNFLNFDGYRPIPDLTRATTQANQEDLNWWSWDFRFLKILKLHPSDKLKLSLYRGNLENVQPLYCLWDTFNCEIDCNWTCSCNCKEKSTSEKIPDDDGYDFFN